MLGNLRGRGALNSALPGVCVARGFEVRLWRRRRTGSKALEDGEAETATATRRGESSASSSGRGSDFSYNPAKGQELSKVGGGTLLVLVAIYGFSRLLARRATYFSKVKIASRSEEEELLERSREKLLDAKKEGGAGEVARPPRTAEKKGPKDVFTNAATVGAISLALFVFSSKLEGYISSIELPDQYTVRQVSITLKTIVVGLSYLACFIYGANTLGLVLLGIDMVRNPEKHELGEGDAILPDEE
ncbi:hypothetical protein HOP50_02g11000 [Chloropicon primus]|uniref:Uncharacterized protein n=2 Tax=Chloropicon primus TaxID=1764295 RepID=A0A5B8MDF4_9CHLO|nr:hypothetical protein A3770_02p11140 [Chloropicon primus]UPQ97805.1 hypothetical protein HOP50_02g11000 [Chloropicon primus]|eukprot:QDZ18596.1 hypothetical protein A3770_02p11140 [Chloropicon primus]